MSTTATRIAQAEAIAKLQELLHEGDTVYTIIRHVSASGMTRHISTVIVRDGEIEDISWLVARATESRIDPKHGGVKVGGAGMDMGFHLVYSLSRSLFEGERGGYALKQRWL